MDQALEVRVREILSDVRSEVNTDWENAVLDAGISLLRSEGPGAVQEIVRILSTMMSGDSTMEQIRNGVDESLSLRGASDFLAVLENQEADKLVRTREILLKLMTVARIAADELLKLVLRRGSA